MLKKADLNLKKKGFYVRYNNSIDPSIANSFATATFRFGHTLIPALMKFITKNSSDAEYIQFHKMLFNPFRLYRKDGLDGSLLGAMNTTIEASDTYFNPEVGDAKCYIVSYLLRVFTTNIIKSKTFYHFLIVLLFL